jgi:hypothetical protein
LVLDSSRPLRGSRCSPRLPSSAPVSNWLASDARPGCGSLDSETNIRHSRQDLRLIAFLLFAILMMLGVIADHLAAYLDRLARLASRTPAPAPFSGINSTPAFSRALIIASIVRSCADKSAAQFPPGRVSVHKLIRSASQSSVFFADVMDPS